MVWNHMAVAAIGSVIAMDFGIVVRTPPLYTAPLRNRSTDLQKRCGNPARYLPVRGMFLVRRDGIIARCWVNIGVTTSPVSSSWR